MQTLIKITLVLLVTATRGDDERCTPSSWGFEVCTNNGDLQRVNHKNSYLSGKYLTLDLDGDTTIGPDVFSSLDLEVLRIALPRRQKDNRFKLTLLPDSFKTLTKLTNLTISHAKIKFDGNPLIPLQSLISLEFLNCNFTEVPKDILAAVPNLEELSFEGNQISEIHQNDFGPLKNTLQVLDFSHNLITNVEPGSFEGMHALKRLELSFNSVPPVPGLLRGLERLRDLHVHQAFGTHGFPPSILQEVPQLVEIQLGGNNLTLSPGMFDAVPHLRDISLAESNIRDIPKGVFEKLRSLEEISLIDNKIETITPGAFGQLNLKFLILASNRVRKTIRTDTFNGLTVGRLDFDKSSIAEIEPKAFNGLTVIRSLDLSDNRLTAVKIDDFSGLKTKDLDLSGNPVHEIAENAFKETEIKRLGLFRVSIPEAKTKWGLAESVEILK